MNWPSFLKWLLIYSIAGPLVLSSFLGAGMLIVYLLKDVEVVYTVTGAIILSCILASIGPAIDMMEREERKNG